MPSVAAARRHDLTDAQWVLLQPLLPAETGRGRPRRWARRQIIDGIRWRVRTGSPWRDVPAVYPPWPTLYRWFRRWQRDGTWARILASLQAQADACGLIGWTVSVDSTISRAHQHAAGARRDGAAQKEPPGGVQQEPGDHGLGVPAAAGPPRHIWPVSRAASCSPWWSPPGSAVTVRSSSPFSAG